MRKKHLSDSPPFSFSSSPSSSSSSFYPSSLSSSPSFSSESRSPTRPRDHMESLIIKHGYPTPISLSSLRDLTATSSTYYPPSPRSRRARLSDSPPIDALGSLSLSSTRPIPIPRRPEPIYDDFPVTPLTGRFEKTDYLYDWERTSVSAKSRHTPIRSRRRICSRARPSSSMRSENSPFYSPVASPTMSPRRPSSPQPPRSRTQNSTKPVSGFNLGSLPRFHPAVYQSSTSHNATGQPPSPRQSRQNTYRPTTGSRDLMWQYRDSKDSPSAPRLDPLRSPGPVTPLALESGDYLASDSTASERLPREASARESGPPPDLVEKLIARENERARQKNRKSTKSR